MLSYWCQSPGDVPMSRSLWNLGRATMRGILGEDDSRVEWGVLKYNAIVYFGFLSNFAVSLVFDNVEASSENWLCSIWRLPHMHTEIQGQGSATQSCSKAIAGKGFHVGNLTSSTSVLSLEGYPPITMLDWLPCQDDFKFWHFFMLYESLGRRLSIKLFYL